MTCSFYQIQFTKKAQKSIQQLSPKLKSKLKNILQNKIAIFPRSGKALIGDMKGYYSVRLFFQDRMVYQIKNNKCIVIMIRAKTHYGA